MRIKIACLWKVIDECFQFKIENARQNSSYA